MQFIHMDKIAFQARATSTFQIKKCAFPPALEIYFAGAFPTV
jgi:hypothetical protein